METAYTTLKQAVNELVPYQIYHAELLRDTYVQGNDSGPYGGEERVVAKQPYNKGGSTNRLGYLAFSIDELPKELAKVSLKLYVTQSGSNNTYGDTEIQLHASDSTGWDENMKWSNKPAILSEMLAAYKPGNVHTDNPNSSPVWVTMDVTDCVKRAKASGREEITFVLATNDSGSAMLYVSSKENPDGNAAQLVSEEGGEKTLGQLANEALEMINMDEYVNDPTPDRITTSLNPLPTEINGYNIEWKSSRTDILSNSGEILKRPQKDTQVTLTASLNSNGLTYTRDFLLTVFFDTEGLKDEDLIKYDLDRLEFGMLTEQDPGRIVTEIELPEYLYPGGVTFTWSVSDETVCKIENGTAVFYPKNEEETDLKLIVTGKLGKASVENEFPITVIRGFAGNVLNKYHASLQATSGDPYQATGRDFESCWESDPSDSKPSVTMIFSDPVTVTSALFVEHGDGIQKYTVSSSDDGERWNDLYTGGTLGDCRRELCELPITTAKYFRLTVNEKSSDTVGLYTVELFDELIADGQIAQYDLDQLEIPKSVKSDLTLPKTGEKGSIITWKTSDSHYITEEGKVTRPVNALKTVILTAEAKKEKETKTKEFTVLVAPVLEPGTSGGGSGSGGGRGSGGDVSGGGSVVLPDINPQPTNEPANGSAVYTDVPQSHWAYAYIKNLTDKNVLSGSGDGRFYPDSSVTREEFLKMILAAMNIPLKDSSVSFADADNNAWYAPYVAAAYEMGIVKGIDENTFGIGTRISRQDMAVMAARMLEQKGITADGEPFDYLDAAEVDGYAVDAVAALAALQVMNGNENNRFLPRAEATRAESAKIVYIIANMTE